MSSSADSTRSPFSAAPGISSGAEPVDATVGRTWQLRRGAEKHPGWYRPAFGALVAVGFTVIAGAKLVPGGTVTSVVIVALLVAVALIVAAVSTLRASYRGHTGLVNELPGSARPWWRSPAMVGTAAWTLVFLGGLAGLFDHWPVIVGIGVVLGCLAARWFPGYETADSVTGPRLEHVPTLTADAATAVAAGELTSDVLELLVLQHHTGERRVAWCANVLGTTQADIHGRVRRGRRWFELPATEAHRPTGAAWIRLSSEGRESLGYV
ncbi:UNVERIFIED_ORG: hypothetical protein EDC92_12451 [Dietzia maris]|uniref:hypothetical protein n=1 Tax=Dietzia maris TaxID=37915 RepID=UPI0010CE0C13